MRETITGDNGDLRLGEIEHLNLDLVGRPAVVGIHDTDAVGNHQSAFERRAAAREDAEEISVRHLNNKARGHERDLTRGNRHRD